MTMRSMRLFHFFWMLAFIPVACEPGLAKASKPVHDVAIANISVPSECAQGQIIPVIVTVENRGDYNESVAAKLSSVTEGIEIASKPINLPVVTKADLVLTGPIETNTQYSNYLRFGDVNGDGYEDLLVAGARDYNNSRGQLYLYYGGKDMDDKPDKILTGENAGDKFGAEAHLADVNGDGYADIITGSYGYNDWQGRAYIFYGGPDMDVNADLIIDGEPGTRGRFANMITAGDVNKDGYADVILCAVYLNDKAGRVYLFYGGDPMDTIADLTFDGEKKDDHFGRDINNPKMVGDVNGDGYGDLLLSSRYWNWAGGAKGQGKAHLYYGGPGTSMDSIPDKIFIGENPRDDFGVAGCVFDIDNDGFADLIIGVRGYNNNQGRVYLYWGGEDMDTVADKVFEGEGGSVNGNFGGGLDAGYVNGDAYGDIIATAPFYDQRRWSGRGYLFYGDTKARMDTTCDKTFTLPRDTRNTSQHAALGDLQNDNYQDVAIGGPNYNNGQGRVWIYYDGSRDANQLEFHWDTTTASPGKHVLNAAIAPVAGEKDTADNSVTVEVDVREKTVERK
jgi:hypothetical protein